MQCHWLCAVPLAVAVVSNNSDAMLVMLMVYYCTMRKNMGEHERHACYMQHTTQANALAAGFGGTPWERHGTFYGDFRCFVASLLPTTTIFLPSGVNTHYQWCGIGFTGLPNGIGWGGQENYFGLFIASDMEHAMSRPCATFANPRSLLSDEESDVAVVEVWLVEPVEQEEHTSSSVLDSRVTDQQFLKLAGIHVNHSAGYRAEEPIEID